MLANAIGSALLMTGMFFCVSSVVVAVLIETPRLRWMCKQKGLWRWVLLANLLSLGVGGCPLLVRDVLPRPGPDANPWHWFSTYWRYVAVYAAALFALTVIVEGAVYLWKRRRWMIRMRSVIAGTLIANVVSYTPMVALLMHHVTNTGTVTFLPDTRWAPADGPRVYFIDPNAGRLCSIRTNGSDRRVELEARLGRFESQIAPRSFYALLDDDPRILFVDPDRHWCVADGGEVRTLQARLPEDYGQSWRYHAVASLVEALSEIGIDQPVPQDDQQFSGVYLCGGPEFEWLAVHRDSGPFRMYYGSSPYVGESMYGLIVATQDGAAGVSFRVRAGMLNLACHEPALLPNENTIVFLCGNSIMVMDVDGRRVGPLAQGDSLLLKLPVFQRGEWR